mmetsp:Transcript_26174/g.36243  ORF Transcript_26174/g.36243 Transcript_26174/m.36243 type:complete len:422 (+) Transcript_26174:132-1397(+)
MPAVSSQLKSGKCVWLLALVGFLLLIFNNGTVSTQGPAKFVKNLQTLPTKPTQSEDTKTLDFKFDEIPKWLKKQAFNPNNTIEKFKQGSVSHPGQKRTMIKNAYVTMICKTNFSTYDVPNGMGSELTVLMHGAAVQAIDNDNDTESVLLLVTGGICHGLSQYQFWPEIQRNYDRIIHLKGETALEQLVMQWKHQKHLWLKLHIFNMTEYDTVVWMGYDTMPYRSVKNAFDRCNTNPANDPNNAGYPCMAGGNADFMIVHPSKQEAEAIYSTLKNEAQLYSSDKWRGYDNSFLFGMYRGRLQAMEVPDYWHAYVHHFSGYAKPPFRAYCNSWLPEGAYLPASHADSLWLGTFNSTNRPAWCKDLMTTPQEYMFWQIALHELRPADRVRVTNMLNISHPLKNFPKEAACKLPNVVQTLTRWCA